MPTVDRDCKELLKDVPEYIIKQMQEAPDRVAKLAELKASNARSKMLLGKAKEAQQKLSGFIANHPEGPEVGLRSIMTNDLSAKAENSNVEYRQKALQGMTEMYIPELKQRLSTTKLGFDRDKKLGREFIKALFGEDTASDVAKRLAKEWGNASEFMRTRFNEYGGNIGKLDYGYIKQSHDKVAVRTAGKDEWIKFIEPLLRDDMADLDMGYIYDTIATGGLNKIKEGTSGGKGKALANRNADERVLHFKDADSWLNYQEKFGTPDPMAAIDDTIRKMTTDMSLVEIMGPNPQNMFETLKVQVQKAQAETGKKAAWDSYTDAIWKVVDGTVDRDIDGIGRLGTLSQSARALNTATMLGSATLSATTDSVSLFVNTKYHGMSAFKVMKNFVKNFNVKNHDDAIRMGLGADVFNSEVTRRFSELGSGFWAKASEALMRATFMNIWTEAGRKAFQTEFAHKLLDGRKIADLTTEEHIRLLEKVQEQTDYAVLMPGARVRAITTAGKEKGTFGGEFARTSTQFSSFSLTLMQQHGARILKQGSGGSRIAYGASLISMMTLMGAGAMMAKDTAKGYGMREGFNVFDEDVDIEDNAKFWAAAMLQGAAVGIFGDLLFSDATRYGNSPIPTALGPTASVVEDAYRLTVGNAQEAIAGDNTHLGSELVDFANRHANPANTFYTKAIIENYIARNLKIMLDPEYEKNERRKLKKREKEYGQEQFEWLDEGKEEFTESLPVYEAQEGLQNIIDSLK